MACTVLPVFVIQPPASVSNLFFTIIISLLHCMPRKSALPAGLYSFPFAFLREDGVTILVSLHDLL